MLLTEKDGCHYTALFCEENIWHLAHELIRLGTDKNMLEIVFISNHLRQVAVFNQLPHAIADMTGRVTIWDYHVVLLQKDDQSHFIYDFDSIASFPTPASHYLDLSFPAHRPVPEPYQPLFRLIPSKHYLQHFSSDRSHMKPLLKASQFPVEPVITAVDGIEPVTLQQYWDFSTGLGADDKILNLEQFRHAVTAS